MNYWVVLKNALANIVRGGAGTIMALLLPPFLTRLLPSTTYGTWVLVLQVSAYVNFFDFGIQTAVGRYVAYSREQKDTNLCNRIVSTAFAMLAGSSILALLLVVVLVWQLPRLFPNMPHALHADARWMLFIVGGTLGIGLPFSVYNGIFIGLQRNEIPAVIVGISKLLAVVLVILVAYLSHSLTLMGVAIGVSNLFGYLMQLVIYHRLISDIQLARKYIAWQEVRELTGYCLSLTAWALGMLLVSGLDTAVVGYFDYKAVAYYATAAGLIAFLNGIQSAVFTAMMPVVAALDARNQKAALAQLLITSTRYGMFILLFVGLILFIFAHEVIEFWVGVDYAVHGYRILQVLVVANIIRSSLIPYSILLVGTGQQRLLILSPFAEGFSNLVVSIIAGYFLGAIGVAIGTLFGVIVLWCFCLFYNMPRTDRVPFVRSTYLSEATLQPLACALIPLMLLLPFKYEMRLASISMLLLGLVPMCILIWKTGLTAFERQKLSSYIRLAF